MKIWMFLLVMTTAVNAQDQAVISRMQDVSVTIKAGEGYGSGTLKTRLLKVSPSDKKEVKVSFVWTTAHLLQRATSTNDKKEITFGNVVVIKELLEGLDRVGSNVEMDADIIKYDPDEDLALLRIKKIDFLQANADFYLDEKAPIVGTEIYHVGSMFGVDNINTVLDGIISYKGRMKSGLEFDQSSVTAMPGSSGGGIFLKSGPYIGMVDSISGPGITFYTPVRRIRKWAKVANVEWLVDDKIAAPTLDELNKQPIVVNSKPAEMPKMFNILNLIPPVPPK